MRSTLAWFGDTEAAPDTQHPVTTTCPTCGRKHITVLRLRHASDALLVQLGSFYQYARHFNFRRLRWCTKSGQNPDWSPRG